MKKNLFLILLFPLLINAAEDFDIIEFTSSIKNTTEFNIVVSFKPDDLAEFILKPDEVLNLAESDVQLQQQFWVRDIRRDSQIDEELVKSSNLTNIKLGKKYNIIVSNNQLKAIAQH